MVTEPAISSRTSLDLTGVVALLGIAPGSANRGVQALGASLLQLVNQTAPEAQIVLLSNHHRREVLSLPGAIGRKEVPVVPARLSPRSRLADHLAAIVATALIYRTIPLAGLRRAIRHRIPWIRHSSRAVMAADIRGGDSFSDIYGMQRFLVGFLMAWAVILVRGEIAQLPQTYGPFRSKTAQSLARYLLRRSSVILARDRHSAEIARKLVGESPPVRLCPDVAFALPAATMRSVELDGHEVDLQTSSGASADHQEAPLPVGFNINGLMYNGGYTRRNMFGLRVDYAELVRQLIQRVLEVHPGEVWLIPHTYGGPDSVESDPEACRRVQEALPSTIRPRVRRVTAEYDCCQLKGIIGRCEFFIGSRMHSCIAALSQGIPTVGIAYSDKFQGVFETVGMGDWVIDARRVSQKHACETLIQFYYERKRVMPELREACRVAGEEVMRVFAGLLGEPAVGSG